MLYIAYNKRSSLTAKELKNKFQENGIETRMINKKNFKKKPSILIRIGNSYKEAPEGCIEVNEILPVRNASNKLLMAYKLLNTEGVSFPKAYITNASKAILDAEFGPSESNHGFTLMEPNLTLYYRNAQNIVRKRNSHLETDLYGTSPIERSREFRVHVFKGKTIGVYEKIPREEGVIYCKAENCDFRRIDVSNEGDRSSIKGVRPMAVAAVEALGLTFGGADVIISSTGEIFVNEVNSAPSLNSLNIDRYYEKIVEFIETKKKENEDRG